MAIRILTNSSTFLQRVKDQLGKQFRPQLQKAAEGLRRELADKIPKWIDRSLEVYFMREERNRNELGIDLDQIRKAMQDVGQVIVDAIEIEVLKGIGGLRVSFKQSILSQIESLDSGKYISTNSRGQKKLVEWLAWLVKAGSSVVIEDYHYVDEPHSGQKGRTGGGLMFVGGVWRVPMEISGNSQDNFITRTMEKKSAEILRLMRGHMLGEDKSRTKYQIDYVSNFNRNLEPFQ